MRGGRRGGGRRGEGGGEEGRREGGGGEGGGVLICSILWQYSLLNMWDKLYKHKQLV